MPGSPLKEPLRRTTKMAQDGTRPLEPRAQGHMEIRISGRLQYMGPDGPGLKDAQKIQHN